LSFPWRPCDCVAGAEKLAGTAVNALLCWGAKTAGCPGTLSGAGEPCTAEAEVGAAWDGADAAGWPGTFSGVGAGAGVAWGGGEDPGCPGTLSGTGALCG
jgi:hypothetical protein